VDGDHQNGRKDFQHKSHTGIHNNEREAFLVREKDKVQENNTAPDIPRSTRETENAMGGQQPGGSKEGKQSGWENRAGTETSGKTEMRAPGAKGCESGEKLTSNLWTDPKSLNRGRQFPTTQDVRTQSGHPDQKRSLGGCMKNKQGLTKKKNGGPQKKKTTGPVRW